MMTEAKKPSLKEKVDTVLDREFSNPIHSCLVSLKAACFGQPTKTKLRHKEPKK